MMSLSRIETLVRQLQGLLGGLAIRAGAGTVTWPGGSQTSTALTVTHGLGRTPVAVVATNTSAPNPMFTMNYTATTFQVVCGTNDLSSPANGVTNGFVWVAVG